MPREPEERSPCQRHEGIAIMLNTLVNRVDAMDKKQEKQEELNEKILTALDDIKNKLLVYSIYLSLGVGGFGLVIGNLDKIQALLK